MKIAHEAPIALLTEVSERTDYDYALVHLFEKYPEYYSFFKKSLKSGREVILDNSIFELGSSFDMKEFYKYVKELSPTYYIIPDVLEDYRGTIENLHKWMENYQISESKSIGVVQGRTYDELVKCYEEIEKYCDMIAISFDYSYYQSTYPHFNKFISFMMGRRYFIKDLLVEGIIGEKPIHLLGCSLPQEFLWYQKISCINSVDTSNPIVSGLHFQEYHPWGLNTKNTIKLVDLIETQPTEDQKRVIFYNIKQFRRIVNGD